MPRQAKATDSSTSDSSWQTIPSPPSPASSSTTTTAESSSSRHKRGKDGQDRRQKKANKRNAFEEYFYQRGKLVRHLQRRFDKWQKRSKEELDKARGIKQSKSTGAGTATNAPSARQNIAPPPP